MDEAFVGSEYDALDDLFLLGNLQMLCGWVVSLLFENDQ